MWRLCEECDFNFSLSTKKIEFLHPSGRASSVQESTSVNLSFSTKKIEFFHPSGRASSEILYIIHFLTIRLMIKLLTLIQIWQMWHLQLDLWFNYWLNMHLFYHVKFIPPIPIWVWEIDLSESWLKGICDHTPDEDHMGSEHKCDNCN